VLQKGRVEQIGTPEAIYDRPATEFVASFVGSINVLKGNVEGGRAALGTLAVHAPPGTGDGARLHAFIRPHDVELRGRVDPDADDADGDSPLADSRPAVATAEIERMSRVGFMVKMDLRLADGQPLAVELTKDRVAALDLHEGDRVLVNLRDAKVFVQDYAI
jgi:sulfate transport system ATP-binding protein